MISLSPAPQPPRCSGGELQVRAELCVVVADMCSSMVDLGRKGSRATGDTGSGKGVRLRVDQIGGEVVERWAESVQGWSSPAGFQTCTVGRDTVFTPRKKDTRQKPYPPPPTVARPQQHCSDGSCLSQSKETTQQSCTQATCYDTKQCQNSNKTSQSYMRTVYASLSKLSTKYPATTQSDVFTAVCNNLTKH